MPSKMRLRLVFAPVVKLLGKFFAKIGVTPNLATIGMLICAIVATYMLFIDNILWFGIMIFVTGIMDGVDGAIARITQKTSKFGGFFDSTMDRISEGVIFTGLLINKEKYILFPPGISTLLIALSLISAFMFSYMRARCELIQKGFDTNVGLMARSERLFFIFLISIFAHFYGLYVFTWGFVIFTALTFLSFIYRFYSYKTQISSKETEEKTNNVESDAV